jgi:MraZ protein
VEVGKCVILCQEREIFPEFSLMIGFLGEYESTLDAKGRFLLPVGFKKQLPGDGTADFVINRGFEKCLTLYTRQSWDPIFEQISRLNDFEKEARAFRRYYLNGATYLETDTAGRLLIPKNLLEYAGLVKDIVLTAAVNKIEVWDKATYQQFFDTYSAESFSDLAQKVMGGLGNV